MMTNLVIEQSVRALFCTEYLVIQTHPLRCTEETLQEPETIRSLI